eukprot:Pgem_evm1s6544
MLSATEPVHQQRRQSRRREDGNAQQQIANIPEVQSINFQVQEILKHNKDVGPNVLERMLNAANAVPLKRLDNEQRTQEKKMEAKSQENQLKCLANLGQTLITDPAVDQSIKYRIIDTLFNQSGVTTPAQPSTQQTDRNDDNGAVDDNDKEGKGDNNYNEEVDNAFVNEVDNQVDDEVENEAEDEKNENTTKKIKKDSGLKKEKRKEDTKLEAVKRKKSGK